MTTGAVGTVIPPASGRDVGGVAVTAQWGNVPTLAAVEDAIRSAQPQRTFARTTVGGRSALLTRMEAKEEFSLVWIERDGLALDVAAGTPVSEDDMRRVSEELTVGSRPRVDPTLDRAVRAAVAQVFTGGTPTGRTLAAVENGEELAPGLERHRAQHPGLARTLRVHGARGGATGRHARRGLDLAHLHRPDHATAWSARRQPHGPGLAGRAPAPIGPVRWASTGRSGGAFGGPNA
ncbi:hypothetical protein [Parafrankia elaeagni]|uniref:hypothetical protein n=1 Tax=Parafrankia elaeagni TaxID=222534 RepID=UPI000372BB83|nr:hypothetical protein [Parafrankia elaeagni]